MKVRLKVGSRENGLGRSEDANVDNSEEFIKGSREMRQ